MANRQTTFLLKRSNVPGKIPPSSGLTLGELALNTADAILYTSGTTQNSILPIGWDRIHRTGDTMTGTLYVSTISASTYLNLPIDVFVTGGTYNNGTGTATFTNNTGGTFSVSGFSTSSGSGTFTGGTVTGATIFTNGLTANTISATTYFNLPTDIRVTGATYNNNTFTYTNNTGGTFSVLFNTVTGLTVNGNLTVTGTTNTGSLSATSFSSSTLTTSISNTQVVYSNNGVLTGSTALTWTNSATTLTINGTLEATSKSFSIPHPTKEGKKLIYGSLEGPENGVYHRGILSNDNIITLPEYWYKLVDENSITVHLTPIGKYQKLYVKEIMEDKIIIGIDSCSFCDKTIKCHYIVYGERKDINKLEVER